MKKLKDLPFFAKFPDALVEQLQSCARLLTFKESEQVIAQGRVNDSLFFLISGKLGVYLDGGFVIALDTPGDLIGEMSLITGEPSKAAIHAESDAQLIEIDGESLHRLTEQEGDTLQFHLYKIYSDILVHKLDSTNHRAKRFEETAKSLEVARQELQEANQGLESKVQKRTAELARNNDALLQKNTELQATHDKIMNLYQSRDITFKALGDLLNENLVPLQENIRQFVGKDKEKNQQLQKVQTQVSKAIKRLEPLTTSFQSEKLMNQKRVLLAETVKKMQSVAKMALGGTGVQLDIAPTEDEAREKLAENKYDIFMLNKEFLNLVPFAKETNEDMEFVFVTSDDIPTYVPSLLGQPFVPNVVSRDEQDRQFTIKNFVTTISKLASGNYFGLEKYISWGVDVKELEVKGSDQRADLIQEMDEYFQKSGVRNSNRSRVSAVAEELLMNAIYDAPKDLNGDPIFNHKSRTESIQLREDQYGAFRFATDGVLMAISVEDPFGGLDADTLFKYLEKCYAGGSLNDGRKDKGGGGRGLHQIVENSDLVVFNILPNKRTEVIALFNIDQNMAADRQPNLHYFLAS
ncbi:MAG: cyclic nucleotide-binding domain-containing protein [Pseudomonadota bacterium]